MATVAVILLKEEFTSHLVHILSGTSSSGGLWWSSHFLARSPWVLFFRVLSSPHHCHHQSRRSKKRREKRRLQGGPAAFKRRSPIAYACCVLTSVSWTGPFEPARWESRETERGGRERTHSAPRAVTLVACARVQFPSCAIHGLHNIYIRVASSCIELVPSSWIAYT